MLHSIVAEFSTGSVVNWMKEKKWMSEDEHFTTNCFRPSEIRLGKGWTVEKDEQWKKWAVERFDRRNPILFHILAWISNKLFAFICIIKLM